MSVKSSETKQKSKSSKKSPVKKQSNSRKSKSKKPKVVLAKTKVALLCGLICGICVLAIGVNIALHIEEKAPVQHIAKIEERKEEVKSRNTEKRSTETQKVEVQKKEAQKTDGRKQESETQKKETKKTEVPKKEAQKPETQKTEMQQKDGQKAETQKKETQQKKSSSNVKVVTKEMKENSSVVKTIPQSQTSSAGKANTQVASAKTPSQEEKIQQNIPKNRFDIPPASNGATIVIIIDDAGRSVENTKRYTALPFPITIAVLPKLPQSRACADAIRAAGKEVILHQPMQSLNHDLDPGPGKITSEMTTYEIAQIVKQNLTELGPGVRGMNNHEGSDVTSNEIKIGAVLEVCTEMGVYFLDSRTTAATKAPQAALERDMHIFEKAGPYLDNDIDRAKMLERMRETLAYANKHGRAIVIGHVDKSVKILPDLLAEMYPEMKAAGYRFATPSQLK